MNVVFLLDESGSMGSVRDEVMIGVNDYIKTLKDNPFVKFTLISFNGDRIRKVYETAPITDVGVFTDYHPDSNTPLLDAMGSTIKMLGKKKKVVFVVQTDGYENSSSIFTTKMIFDLVTKRKKRGWTFAFMGSDIDSWSIAKGLGFDRGNTLRYKSGDTVNIYAQLGEASSRAVSGDMSGTFWGEATDQNSYKE